MGKAFLPRSSEGRQEGTRHLLSTTSAEPGALYLILTATLRVCTIGYLLLMGKLRHREVTWPAQEHEAVSDELSLVCLMQGIVCPLSHPAAEGGSKEMQDGRQKAAHILHSS